MKKMITGLWGLFFLFPLSICTGAGVEVRVGGYVFPPFVENLDGQRVGITFDMIRQMNELQDVYVFKFVPTSSKRRYRDFEQKRFDLMMFESMQWGWADKPVEASDTLFQGGELYIARALPGRDQSYFDDFTGKQILGYVGYHYGFADFNADEAIIKERFNLTMTLTHEGNIRSIAAGRADVAVLSLSFLNKFLYSHPEFREKLLVSQKMDQRFNHTMLMRAHMRPGISEINALIQRMKENGMLEQILKAHGIR